MNQNMKSTASTTLALWPKSSPVTSGFRFLKDPLFFADSLFLKNPGQIMTLIMIMGLALLIFSLEEC
jgi:transposase